MSDRATLYTTWPMLKVSHAAGRDWRTLCGKPLDETWDEGGFIDPEDNDLINCRRCQAAMRRIAKEEAKP